MADPTPTDDLIETSVGHARYIRRSDGTWFMSWRDSSCRPVPSEAAAAILDALAEARAERDEARALAQQAIVSLMEFGGYLTFRDSPLGLPRLKENTSD
jgi:hypothetical protein